MRAVLLGLGPGVVERAWAVPFEQAAAISASARPARTIGLGPFAGDAFNGTPLSWRDLLAEVGGQYSPVRRGGLDLEPPCAPNEVGVGSEVPRVEPDERERLRRSRRREGGGAGQGDGLFVPRRLEEREVHDVLPGL